MLPLLTDATATTLSDDQFNRLIDLAQSHSGMSSHPEGVIAVVMAFSTPVIVILAVLWYRSRRQARQHDAILKLAELGQPVPPQLFAEELPRRSDLGRALTLIAVGIGIGAWLYTNGNADEVGFALIPLLVGVARLIAWKVERRDPLLQRPQ